MKGPRDKKDSIQYVDLGGEVSLLNISKIIPSYATGTSRDLTSFTCPSLILPDVHVSPLNVLRQLLSVISIIYYSI